MTLDPLDWRAFRSEAHRALDASLDRLEGIRAGPVWRAPDAAALAAFSRPLPGGGRGEAATVETMLRHVLPFGTGNTHPRFFGWVHGAGLPIGVVAELVAAAMNANLGGRYHGAIAVERQVLAWCHEIYGFPPDAGGLLVSGTSIATVVGLAVALHQATDGRCRSSGVPGDLVGYASTEAHSCIAKAFSLLGLGSERLRRIRTDAGFRMDMAALAEAVGRDRRNGLRPFVLVGTAGTVATGAIDDLVAMAELATSERLWLHVDGAFGALAQLSPVLCPLVAGIERADSLAFDFHKWAHVPYDAGCILVRDGALHRAAFAERPSYLASNSEGLAGGEPWFCDFGPELSRGFRALKVWAAIDAHGIAGIGRAIEENCRLVAYLAERVRAHPELELMAPPSLSVACLRYSAGDLDPPARDALNAAIVRDLQDGGVAVPSSVVLPGGFAMRVNITNHRTTQQDVDLLVDTVIEAGRRLRS